MRYLPDIYYNRETTKEEIEKATSYLRISLKDPSVDVKIERVIRLNGSTLRFTIDTRKGRGNRFTHAMALFWWKLFMRYPIRKKDKIWVEVWA